MTVPIASEIRATTRHMEQNINILATSNGCAVSGYVKAMKSKLNTIVAGTRDTTKAA